MANQPPGFRLRGVGEKIAKHLARLDIHSVVDLLLHLPSRYQDRTRVQSIRQVIPGEDAVVEGVIRAVEKPLRGRTKLLCELFDGSGKIQLRFFHALTYQKEIHAIGARLRCYAQVRFGPKGLEMVHPEIKVITEDKPLPIEKFLTPIYPATEGLSQYMLRKLAANALAVLESESALRELLPLSLLQSLAFPTLKEAIAFVHQPPRETSIDLLLESKTVPQQRLVFEELLTHRLSLLQAKTLFQSQHGIALPPRHTLIAAFLKQLPYALTGAQKRVVDEVANDLASERPMLRLVQGDVGSGKTVVAALALLQAVENGYQSAMMAPTELLAEQHCRVFKRWLEPLGVKVAFLSGNIKGRARKEAYEAIQAGEVQIILGTHALFQQDVHFKNLALIVVDEQHRFGVHQRALFREKGASSSLREASCATQQASLFPHQLIMTATPIPRTLAMSFYADLDCSIIDELPPGRTPIMTSVIADSRREEVTARVREACQQGRQAYWVCPLIDESEVIACQAATKVAEQLQQILQGLTVGLIHGRMSASEKEKTMQAFQQGVIQVLVATTVIEVGVDVPNASLMIIENAERLGLSQLHQLRGRVGRGSVASHCVLMYQQPLSALAKERLSVMRESSDGFKIAQRDLELRGPGEVLGTRQTGDLTFQIADLMRDSALLPKVQQAADQIIKEYPQLIAPLIDRWMGDDKEYGKV